MEFGSTIWSRFRMKHAEIKLCPDTAWESRLEEFEGTAAAFI
jgi:hypothetical protein